jgi:hypothetical protein
MIKPKTPRYWANVRGAITVEKYHLKYVKDFKKTSTNYTVTFESGSGRFICSVKFVGLPLIWHGVRLKTEIREREDKIFWDAYRSDSIRPSCFAFREFPEKCLAVYEYDKTAAYLTAARELNVISQKTFNKIKGFSKQARLFLLGSLATVKREKQFINSVQVSEKTKQDDYLRQVWFLIVGVVDSEMKNIYKDNPDIMFYWYDQFYSISPVTLTNPETFKVRKLEIVRKAGHVNLSDGRSFPYAVSKRTGEILPVHGPIT